MRVRRSARIGGLSFVSWPADHHGDWFVLDQDGIQSLWGGVDVRREDIPRPAAHGSFDLPGFLTPRVIPVSGHMSSRSPEGLENLQGRLSGLLAAGGKTRLTIDGPNGSRWCDVRLASATQITQVDATTARFLVTFWAADPRMYGEVREFASGATAVHYGNFPATPRLLVSAGSGGYTVTGPNGRVVTVGTAPAGAHYIDFANGGLYTAAGVRVSGAITVYQPWKVGPGLPGAVATISGSRSLAQRVTDTYV